MWLGSQLVGEAASAQTGILNYPSASSPKTGKRTESEANSRQTHPNWRTTTPDAYLSAVFRRGRSDMETCSH
jgi:hypothetical protein